MRKIACVFSFAESSWISCQKIVFNLHKAYETLPGVEIKNFNYRPDSLKSDILELAAELEAYAPDTLVIMDHRPHPLRLFKLLSDWFKNHKTRVIFHVFGDFTLYYKDWSELGKLLEGQPVEFVAASERQKRLIDLFLKPGLECQVCPFPVQEKEFFFSTEERKLQRKQWGVKDDELIFTFTGRVSRQKRIHTLLRLFSEALDKTGATARLYIYGQPDHLGDHFLNIWENENEYFRRIHRQWKALPQKTQSRIHFMGPVPNSELRAVYAGSDYLINLSVHNDEDYGMSVAEAKMSGLPALLTDWGGLASFECPELPDATQFFPVRIGESSKVIPFLPALKILSSTLGKSPFQRRAELQNFSRTRFSIPAAGKKVEEILARDPLPFPGFSEFHLNITQRMEHHLPVYLTRKQSIHPIYRRLYSSYVRNP